MNILTDILKHKLIFLETKDVVETTLALENFKRACDSGKGAVFFSSKHPHDICFSFRVSQLNITWTSPDAVSRGKVAEGVDFDR